MTCIYLSINSNGRIGIQGWLVEDRAEKLSKGNKLHSDGVIWFRKLFISREPSQWPGLMSGAECLFKSTESCRRVRLHICTSTKTKGRNRCPLPGRDRHYKTTVITKWECAFIRGLGYTEQRDGVTRQGGEREREREASHWNTVGWIDRLSPKGFIQLMQYWCPLTVWALSLSLSVTGDTPSTSMCVLSQDSSVKR